MTAATSKIAGLALLALACAPPALAAGNPDWFAGIVRKTRDTTSAAVPGASLADSADSLSQPTAFFDSLATPGVPPESPGWEIDGGAPRIRAREGRDLRARIDYNRVDQLLLGLATSPLPAEPFLPRLDIEGSYSLGRSQWHYLFGVEQPITRGPNLSVGARVYRLTDSDDWDLLSRAENALSALLLRQDYRDYFGRRGAQGFMRLAWGEGGSIRAAVRVDDLTSLGTRPGTWSLLGGGRQFRPNPDIPEGVLHQVELVLRLSSRGGQPAPRPGMDLHATLEKAGGGLGGEFRFWHLEAEHRWTVKIAPGVWVNQRFAAGSVLSGSAPREFLFYVGGVGTLRGYDYKQFGGDRYYLYNLEYAANLGRHVAAFDRDELLRGVEVVFFSEFGKAWNSNGEGATTGSGPAWDVGVGLQTSGDGFHLYLSQDLQEPGNGPRLSARLRRSF